MRILIVTDGTQTMRGAAKGIAAALVGNKVVVREAAAFVGTDLLPADFVFIGCEEPSPPSFGYLDELLRHINLAGRGSAVFTHSSKKAALYLNRLLKSSGAAISREPLFAETAQDISGWAAGVITGTRGSAA